MSKFFITTPIYYVNAEPHIGHTYTTVGADVLARFHRMCGDTTFFLTGTDEHGANIEARARQAGKKSLEFTDEIAAKFQFAWDELNISFDRFIRTTEQDHTKAVAKALEEMYKKGDIYKGKYEGMYCRGCEQYKSERDLVKGKCPEHNTVPEKMSEDCYMFKLSKYGPELLNKIKKGELEIMPAERRNEIISFYEKDGLNDIAFSRKNVKWGIPLPWDKTQTAYVWADAFLNYLTGLGWEGAGKKTPPQSSPKRGEGDNLFRDFWPPDLQLMSKDILRVHATIWPAMLLSLGLPLPKKIFVHGYFLIGGKKMSKTIGNVIAPQEMIKRYGVDATRFLLLYPTPFGNDGDISWEKFDNFYKAYLANGIGNLVSRIVSLVDKYYQGRVPERYDDLTDYKYKSVLIKNSIKKDWDEYMKYLKDISIFGALSIIFTELVNHCDHHISHYELWKLVNNNKEEGAKHIYGLLEILRHIAWMLWPFMPETAEKIWQQLGLDASKELAKDFKEAIKWGGLKPGNKVKKGEALFPRIDN